MNITIALISYIKMYNHKNLSANKRLPEAFGIIQTVCDTTLRTYRANIRMHLYAQKS